MEGGYRGQVFKDVVSVLPGEGVLEICFTAVRMCLTLLNLKVSFLPQHKAREARVSPRDGRRRGQHTRHSSPTRLCPHRQQPRFRLRPEDAASCCVPPSLFSASVSACSPVNKAETSRSQGQGVRLGPGPVCQLYQ